MTGRELQQQLGLSNIKHVFIQRVLQTGTPTFVFTFDSHFPKGHLSAVRVMKSKTQQINKIKKISGIIAQNPARMTMPQRLDALDDFRVSGNELFIMRDLAGDYMRDKKLFEDVKFNLNVFYV
jgi:hypothetical protein